MTTETTERIEIPNWITNIFYEEQKDPDEAPGIRVIVKLWDEGKRLLWESVFIYTGQDKECLIETAIETGIINECSAHWKGLDVECQSDMIGQHPTKGSKVTLTVSNLGMIQ